VTGAEQEAQIHSSQEANVPKFKLLLGPMRAPFLVLPPVCVLLGMAVAVWTHGSVQAGQVILILIGSVAAHISVNALNEYFDFKSGLDFRTMKTPFSGGSGTLPAQPEMVRAALITGLVSLAITGLVGLYLLTVWGWALLPLGLLGIAVIVVYTTWLTRNWLLCLIAPGLGFGVLMVMGTAFGLTGAYTWPAFLASLVPFFLVSDLLLLNQFPDAEADQTVGRKHLPIVAGRRTSAVVYSAFLAATYVSIVVGVAVGLLPAWSLLGLLTLPLAVVTARGALRYAEDMPKLAPYMGFNVLLNILTPLLMGIGLLIAA
jgi:1,4-dihydroxy-2-naphthoate polyprenyltransferase